MFSTLFNKYSRLPRNDSGSDDEGPLLPQQFEASDETSVEKESPRTRDTVRFGPNAHLSLIVLCLAWTAINSGLLLYTGRDASTSQVISKDAVLRRPSQYIGLDDIYRNGTDIAPPGPITNHPYILAQVSSVEKDRVFPDDPHRTLMPIGYISPEDHRFLVDDYTSTIAQFRVMDYGMEECELVLNVPAPQILTAAHAANPHTTIGEKKITLSAPAVMVDVWRLDYTSTHFLDPKNLSWNTRPMRAQGMPLATFIVSNDTTAQSGRFPCTADSLQTFEFACATEGCKLDFWQDREEPMLATYLLQHSSL